MKDKNGVALSSQEILFKLIKRLESILQELGVFVLHVIGNFPSHHVRRFFYRMSGMKIGNGSVIHTGARFYDPSGIKLGSDSIIGENAVLDGRGHVLIGDHVDIASEVMIYNCEHDINDENFKAKCSPVIIGNHVFIGPRAIILPGVIIGDGAIIAAGAVVTKEVAPFKVVGGVPAREIADRHLKKPSYRLGRARWFR